MLLVFDEKIDMHFILFQMSLSKGIILVLIFQWFEESLQTILEDFFSHQI